MKLNFVVVTIGTILLVGVANAAEVYNKAGNKVELDGKINGLHYFSDNESQNGDKTWVRLGFKGETQINDHVVGYGRWQYEFKGNNSEASNSTSGNKSRLAFAGLKFSDFGSLDYGRNYGIAYDAASFTDVLPEFGGDGWVAQDNFLTKRATGVLTYRNTDFFGLVEGLNFGLQYQGKNQGDRNPSLQNGDGFGLSTSYEFYDFTITGAYARSDRTDDQIALGDNNVGLNAKGEIAEVWGGGAKYNVNGFYLATTYAETHNMTAFGKLSSKGYEKVPGSNSYYSGSFIANKTRNVEIVAQYLFDFGLKPSVAFISSKGYDLGKYGNKDLVKYIDLGVTYFFNKNMSAYIDYKLNLLDKSDVFYNEAGKINTDDITAIGIQYQF